MKIIGGIDIGNGYVKGILKSKTGIDEVDIASGLAIITRPNYVPIKGQEEIEKEINDLFQRLDASFISPLVPDTYRRLFGRRSLSSSGAFEEFDTTGNASKASQSLSKALTLGIIAAKALKDYYNEHKELPESTLNVEGIVSLALPITEYSLYKNMYVNALKDTVHTVCIHNFEECITVKIKFTSVKVTAEGASAQYAIYAKGEPLMAAMLEELKQRDPENKILEDITPKDVLAAKNVIGIDIGEGTVNYVVFSDNRFNTDASTTLPKGYGSVLTETLRSMQEQNYPSGFSSRKQLADYMEKGPTPLKRNHYNRIQQFIDEEIIFFSKDIAQKFGQVLSNVGGSTEVCYVYGGGANNLKDSLYPLLLEKIANVQGEDSMLVLYLDSTYSRNLNREGLYLISSVIDDMTNEN